MAFAHRQSSLVMSAACFAAATLAFAHAFHTFA